MKLIGYPRIGKNDFRMERPTRLLYIDRTQTVTMLKNLKEIPEEDLEKVIASSWHKDFSKKAMTSLVSKFRKAFKSSKKRRKGRF